MRGIRSGSGFRLLGRCAGRALGQALVQKVSAAPELDGWALVERLLADLAVLPERTWLVIDDVHELGSAEALRQLELLVMRAPPEPRFVLATRHDVRLGLHRLRLEGGLTRDPRPRAWLQPGRGLAGG
jgi:LuxR family transcriptional regulator, maltose regulon positive regulatory protein